MVNHELNRRPFLEESLKRGLINVVALAEYLQPGIEAEFGDTVKISAISMAIRRYTDKIKEKPFNAISLSKKSDILLRTDLFEVSILKSESVFNVLKKIYELVNFVKGDVLNTIQGNYEILILTNRKYKRVFLDILSKEKILHTKEKLSSITVDIPKECIDVPGFFYIITREVALADISIVDIVNTRNQASFICQKPPVKDWWNDTHYNLATWWFLSMLRIFSSIDVEGKRSLPPVIDWMENSDIL